MITIDASKKARQELGTSIWNKNGGKGTLNYVMRFGKTEVACMLIEKLLTKRPDSQIIVTVPSDAVLKNWQEYLPTYFNDGINIRLGIDSIEKYVERITSRVKIIPINMLGNMTNVTKVTCTLLIIDEFHKFTTESRFNTLLKVSYNYILGLTGTFPSGEDGRKLSTLAPVIDVITEEEAITNGWISPFVEYNVLLDLPQEDKERYAQFTIPIQEMLDLVKGIRARIKLQDGSFLFKDDYDVLSSMFYGKRVLTSTNKVEYIKSSHIRQVIAADRGWNKDLNLNDPLSEQIDRFWNPTTLEKRVKFFHDAVRKRNEILINHPLKLAAVLEIFRYSKKVTICFNESTDFADIIANGINATFAVKTPIAVCYHSNIESRPLKDPVTNEWVTYKTGDKIGQIKLFGKKTLKDITIEGVRSGKYKFLCTARALDEGVTITNVEQVITTAGTANPIQYKQRTARGKTIDIYNPDKITQIFNICFDDFIDVNDDKVRSRDLSKLEYRQKDNSVVPVTIHGIDGIKLLFANSS